MICLALITYIIIVYTYINSTNAIEIWNIVDEVVVKHYITFLGTFEFLSQSNSKRAWNEK